jgi:hypothetical protein
MIQIASFARRFFASRRSLRPSLFGIALIGKSKTLSNPEIEAIVSRIDIEELCAEIHTVTGRHLNS